MSNIIYTKKVQDTHKKGQTRDTHKKSSQN